MDIARRDRAQRVAGILAARHRGDPDGVAALMATFSSDRALAGASLLLSQLLLQLYGEQTKQTIEECVRNSTPALPVPLVERSARKIDY